MACPGVRFRTVGVRYRPGGTGAPLKYRLYLRPAAIRQRGTAVVYVNDWEIAEDVVFPHGMLITVEQT